MHVEACIPDQDKPWLQPIASNIPSMSLFILSNPALHYHAMQRGGDTVSTCQ